jgi:hypothetical protein
LAGDVAYGTGELLGWLVNDQDITPHIPVWDRSKMLGQGKFTRTDFAYDKDRDVYLCPNGKVLTTTGKAHDGRILKYMARKSDCAACPLKRNCTTGSERRISRDVREAARDHVRALMGTEAYDQSACERKLIETSFGNLKHNLGLTRLRLRGLASASDEFLLAATVQNLKRLVRTIWPPPAKTVIA